MNEEVRGVAIDEAEPPAWARSRFSAAQLGLNRGLLWILLVYMSKSLEASRISVAQRLYVHTIGKDRKEAGPSQEALARDLGIAVQTVISSLQDLGGEGWILPRRRGRSNVYRLAWPVWEVLDGDQQEIATCGRPTAKGEPCGRRAGWGTGTPGTGPCKLHPLELQSLEGSEPQIPPTVGGQNSNGWRLELQPLEVNTPTVGDKYVGALASTSLSTKPSPVLSEGQRTDRNARTREAPAAQPREKRDHSFAARSLVATIPRYRHADGWVRKHLARLAAAALDSGLGRDAVTAYARAVIAEQQFAEHQHIPELREALRRLARDAALGDACPTCGPSCSCDRPAVTEDRLWTLQDQADLEAALDHLGTPTDDLDTTGTP